MRLVARLARLALTALALAVPAGRAEAGEFNTAAAACVPGDPAFEFDRYLVTEGTVMHQPTNKDLITLYCPVSTNITAPSHLELLYFSTEKHPSTFVKAQYIKMSKANGGITSVATVTSQQGVNDDVSAHNLVKAFSDAYKPSSYVYYVRIDLQRRDTTQIVIAYKVTLF